MRWIFVLLVTIGCSSGREESSSNDASTNACAPGETRACACAGGATAAQVCNSTGTAFDPCSGCPIAETDAAASDTNAPAPPDTSPVDTGPPAPGPCSPSNPKGTCPAGESCVSGGCCGLARTCGTTCCASGDACVDWGTKDKPQLRCSRSCSTSTECGFDAVDGTKCCRFTVDAATGKPNGGGVCGPSATDSCRCGAAADCASTVCAPHVPLSGVRTPDGPYVCVANDGGYYHGCSINVPRCGSSGGMDCWKDLRTGSSYCAAGCGTDSDCKSPGVACCAKPPTSACDNAAASCKWTGMCVPCSKKV